jgi:diguanylate cyclase (GGDEF)-like protein
VAAALQSAARQFVLVARDGGEELAFVLPGIADPEPVLARFRAAITELAIPHADSPTGYLTISCGCVVFKSDVSIFPAVLLKASDEALYEAKQSGRNQYVIRPCRYGKGQ